MTSNSDTAPHVFCVSWDSTLALTRAFLLTRSGYKVTSALGPEQAMELCDTKADLLLLGHSVPREQKQRILDRFRQFNRSTALSLLAPDQDQLPDVEYAVEYLDPGQLLRTVQSIIAANRA